MALNFKKLITPNGLVEIFTNGTHDVSDKKDVYVEVKGEPFSLTQEQMDTFLGSNKCELNSIVLNTTTGDYYIVKGGFGEDYYYEKISASGVYSINTNGTHDIKSYATASVEVKGEPYEVLGEDFDRWLTDGTLKVNDIVLYLDDNNYYKVVSDGTNLSYQKLTESSGESAKIVVNGGWQGTAVPNDGTIIKNVYFNTSLSIEEVLEFTNQLPINPEELLNNYIVCVDFSFANGIIIMYASGDCVIGVIQNDTQEVIFQSRGGIVDENITFVGWNPELTTNSVALNILGLSVSDAGTVGTENELLKGLINIDNVFIKDESKSIELTGEYDGNDINVSENGTVNIESLINENKIPLNVNVNVPTYITVASESELPSDVPDGTIAIVEE